MSIWKLINHEQYRERGSRDDDMAIENVVIRPFWQIPIFRTRVDSEHVLGEQWWWRNVNLRLVRNLSSDSKQKVSWSDGYDSWICLDISVIYILYRNSL